MDTNLVYGGSCSVKKELPRQKKTTLALRTSTKRISMLVALTTKRASAPKIKQSGTVAVRYATNGAQCTGSIQFAPSTILSFRPTPIRKGEKIYLRPKLKFYAPNQVPSVRRLFKQRPKFTREQRINAAKIKRRAELAKCAADVKEARECFYRIMAEEKAKGQP